jgi:tetratricopeptide (TPR) repeat protein
MKENRNAGHASNSWLFGICVICALLIKPVQDNLESHLGGPGQESDLLFFSSPSLVKKMALGYDGLLADAYWMRTIQYYGRREEANLRAVRYGNLSTLLDITTTLDPDLMDAYRSGSVFLSEADPVGAGQPGEAIRLLDKGIRRHPRIWRLRYDKGFVYYWYLKDYKAAGQAWLAASKLPHAPSWLAGLAAMALSKGGAIEIAIALWQRQYQESDRASIRENARNHLLSIQIAQDLRTLQNLIKAFRAQNHFYPKSLEELVRGRSDRYRIEDPLGTPYLYDSHTGDVRLSPQTKIHYLE